MIIKAETFLARGRKEVRKDLIIFETFRTYERQKELFRTHNSWTLTSFHLTGNAFDICFFDGKNYTWNASKEDWNKIIQIGKECGLDNLAPLEFGHFQNNFTDLQTMKYQKTIEEDYTPMSITRMKLVAKNWGELETFKAGLKIKTKPKNLRDLKDVISFGRLALMIENNVRNN